MATTIKNKVKNHMNYLKPVANTALIITMIGTVAFLDIGTARGQEVICNPVASKTYKRVKTRNFYVNICGDSSRPTQYVGTSNRGQAIVLPLSSYSNGRYVAVNGNVRYVLTSSFLTVTKGSRVIVKEKVTSWDN
jgi:hypothetical protein